MSMEERKYYPEALQNNVSKEPLSAINIRGYACLVQEVFRIYGNDLGRNEYQEKNLLRKGKTLDPFVAIGISCSQAQDLIEVVEEALQKLLPRDREAVRLRFSLDQPNEEYMPYESIARIIKDSHGERQVTKERARQMVKKGLRWLSYHDSTKKIQWKLWPGKLAPTTSKY
jgi:hypothetical protein